MVRCPPPVRVRLLFALGVLAFGFGALSADDAPKTNTDVPSVFLKQVSEGPKDPLEIQKHGQAVGNKLQPATVGPRIGQAQGSGMIINKEGYVLTAGHVSGTPGRDAQIVLA